MAELLHCGIWAASLLARQYGTQATVSCQTGCSLLKALKLLPISLRYPQAPATFRPPHSHSLPQLHHSGFLAKVQSPHLRTSVLTVLTVWNTLTQKEHSAFKVVLKIHFFLDHQIQDSRASLTLPALLFLLQFIFCIEHVTSKHSITLTYPFSLWSLFPV